MLDQSNVEEDFSEVIKNLQLLKDSNHQKVILFATGSYCPVHYGHLQVFDAASKFLTEKYNIDVLAGYISPSCDLYVDSKLRSESIPFSDRLEMIKRACLEHNSQSNVIHILTSSWEGLQPTFIDFPTVRDHFQEMVDKTFPSENIKVIYIAGADLFVKCWLHNWSQCIAIERPGSLSLSKYETDLSEMIYICNDPTYSEYYVDTSSTKMREKYHKKESLQGLTYPSVIEYLETVLHWK